MGGHGVLQPVNGVYATGHAELIRIVKDEWQWDGLVVSDWFAAHDTTVCALAGLDLEMPGPAAVFGDRLADAVQEGRVPRGVVEDKVRRLLRLARRTRSRTEALRPAGGLETAGTCADELLTEAAAAGFVLLKNEHDTLPLTSAGPGFRLAVIGPNAVHPCYQGGGSAEVNMRPSRSLLSALEERFGAEAVIGLEAGCHNPACLTGLHELDVSAEGDVAHAVAVEYFSEDGEVAGREVRNTSRLTWLASLPGVGASGRGRVRVSTMLTPTLDGAHLFSVRGSGATTLRVGGKAVAALEAQERGGDPAAAWFTDEWGEGSIDLAAGVPVLVEVEMRYRRADNAEAILEYACRQPEPIDALERAVRLADAADAVVLVVGTGKLAESESRDRTSTLLPGRQDALVDAVLAANGRTVVVVNAGAAIDMPWKRAAPAIMYSWFPGDGFADALAAVLAGDLEPGGRLPVTIASDASHYPAYDTVPDSVGVLEYSESVFVGYRHFATNGYEPAFCFGHGLGYTTFDYRDLTLSATSLTADASLTVGVAVRNIGARAGEEVVQLYVSPPQGSVARPALELKAFAAVRVEPGGTAAVTLTLDARALSHWDAEAHRWAISTGAYGIHVGRSSRDLLLSAEVVVAAPPPT